jgi:hypothetical protein
VFLLIFIESPLFECQLSGYLNDDDYQNLQSVLIQNPDTGDLIKGSGGLRKIRVAIRGQGKRGGGRVIYYVNTGDEIWLLTIYAKNEASGIPTKTLKQIKKEMSDV